MPLAKTPAVASEKPIPTAIAMSPNTNHTANSRNDLQNTVRHYAQRLREAARQQLQRRHELMRQEGCRSARWAFS